MSIKLKVNEIKNRDVSKIVCATKISNPDLYNYNISNENIKFGGKK